MTSISGRLTGKILIVAAMTLLLAGAADARSTATIIGTGYIYPNSGGKLAFVQAQTQNPKTLSTKVVTKPAQKVTLKWVVTCSKGKPGGEDVQDPTTEQKPGQKVVTSPTTLPLAMPYPKAKTCSVSLYAYMTKKPKSITLHVLKT